MLRDIESFVDRPQLQWITEVRIMLRSERPDETKSWEVFFVSIYLGRIVLFELVSTYHQE